MASTLLCNSVNSSTAVFSRAHFPALVSKDFPVEFSPYVHCNYYCKTRKQKRKLARVKAKLAEASPTVSQPTQSGGEPLKKLRILVAGGGIGGLVFALAAKKKGFDVVVFEKDMSAIRGEGQYRGPIQIQSNALAALEAIDLEVADEVMKAGCITGDRINGLVDGVSGTWYVKFDTFTPAAEKGLPVTRVISRMTLQQILARAVGEDIIINESNVVEFEDNGDKVTVMLENGQSFAGDLLVGADGIWSKVRKNLFGPNEAIYSGYTCYTGIADFVPADIESVGYRVFLGHKQYFVSSDVGAGKMQWYAFYNEAPGGVDSLNGKKERLLKIFEGWCDNVMDLILATNEDAILRRDIYDRTPILTWGKGRVTLLGDSVHAMQPNLGQGGCMAIEDGFQLALELNKSWKQSIEEGTPIDIVSSLKRYENSRRLRVAIIHGMARMAALMASTYKAYLGVGLGPLSFLTKFRIPHPGRVGGRVFIDLGMPLMLSWVLGGNSSGLEGRAPSCRLSDKASDQLRRWFEDDDALERTINGEWFLLPCGNETGALQPICLSRDESKPCIIGSIAHQDFPGMSIAIPLPQVSADTRDTFTAHLHQALTQKGINAYIDDDNLRRGDEISAALLEAIDESRISIVVLSENYASSSWCLDELVRIIDCKKSKQQIVLPVFYKVNPSVVRHQRESYGKALAKLEERVKDDRLQKWKAALKEVADSSEWRLRKKGSESEFVKKIVQWISKVVNRTYLNVAMHPVGVDTHVQKINSYLSNGMNDTRMIGIFGPGGIGKTTIAKAIYNLIAYQFEGSCFLTNTRETSKQDFGLVQLQKTLLREILGKVGSLKFDEVDQGINVMKKRLCSKKVLLILDDVDQLVQLETLAGKHDWFGLGSRIIITTRDRNLLTKHEVNLTYKVEELDHNKALQLFSSHAFKKDRPDDDYLELTEHVIQYTGGLPLALTVLGTDLHGRSVQHWKSALAKYKRIPNKTIQEKLRISYDGLGDTEKNIFLDIACFFNGQDADYVIKILDNCNFFPNSGIKVLMDKSLITIDEFNRLMMHNLLQEMGREIVRLESPKEPGQRSRLWFHEDVRHVLEENTGTNKIQGILVDLPERDPICLSPEAFEKMKKLRIFINHNACFSEEPSFLSNELRVLDWPEYPVESLPPNFQGENLVVFRMRNSCLKGLKGFQNFQNLTILDFSNCKFLRKIPDVSGIPNLKEVTLDGCTNLVEHHHFVGFVDKLLDLSLQECSNLRSSLISFKLRSPEYLSLENCSRLKNFPPIESLMECVRSLDLQYIGIEELPSSIGYLIRLKGDHPFGIILSENMIPNQFSHRKGDSNSNPCEINIDEACEIDINERAYMDGEMRGIAFYAVFGIMDGHMKDSFDFFADVSNDGSDHVWLHYHVRESFKLKGDDLQVCFGFESDSVFLKNRIVCMVHRHEEKATDLMLNTQDLGVLHEDVDVHLGVPDEDIENSIDMMDGIQLTKRGRDDDDYANLESNWHSQQKRRLSTLGIKISDERICHLVNHSYSNQITPST